MIKAEYVYRHSTNGGRQKHHARHWAGHELNFRKLGTGSGCLLFLLCASIRRSRADAAARLWPIRLAARVVGGHAGASSPRLHLVLRHLVFRHSAAGGGVGSLLAGRFSRIAAVLSESIAGRRNGYGGGERKCPNFHLRIPLVRYVKGSPYQLLVFQMVPSSTRVYTDTA